MTYQSGADYTIAEKNARLAEARDEIARLIEERTEANRIAADALARGRADTELVALVLAEARLGRRAESLAVYSSSAVEIADAYAAHQAASDALRAAVRERLEGEGQ